MTPITKQEVEEVCKDSDLGVKDLGEDLKVWLKDPRLNDILVGYDIARRRVERGEEL